MSQTFKIMSIEYLHANTINAPQSLINQVYCSRTKNENLLRTRKNDTRLSRFALSTPTGYLLYFHDLKKDKEQNNQEKITFTLNLFVLYFSGCNTKIGTYVLACIITFEMSN